MIQYEREGGGGGEGLAIPLCCSPVVKWHFFTEACFAVSMDDVL